MASTDNKQFRMLRTDEINKLSEDEAREYLINLLNSICGLKYGHFYNKDEISYMNTEYNKLKDERIKNGSTVETEYETKLRNHLSIPLPDNTTETITKDLKNRIEFPDEIVSKWAIYH